MVADDALLATAEKAIDDAVTLRGRIGGDRDGWEDVHDWWSAGPADDPEVAVADDDPLRLMYTSGTESRPKGVLLPSRSLISQYVSCVIDGEMAADDVEAHSLPMYHCAQLDCFFSVDVYLGATSIILPAPEPAALLAHDRAGAGDEAVLPAHRVDLAAAARRLRHPRPLVAAQGLLRGVADARRGAQGARTAAARRAVLELLRPDRDGPAGHDPAAPRAGEPRRLGGPGVDQRRDDAGRRRRAAGARGRGRRDRAPLPARHAGLLRERGEDRRGVRAAAGSTPATSA